MAADSKAKLIYIFVAGVEGCGHHGLNPVIANALAHSRLVRDSGGEIVRNKRRLKRIWNWYWCYSHPFGFTRPLVRAMINRFFREERKKSRRNNQVRVVVEDNSFPAGDHRDPRKQWNIVEMIDMVRPYADEIYLLGLYRNPMAAVFSHPELDGGFLPHAQVLKVALAYINTQLAQLSDLPQLFVRYEDLVHAQEQLAPVIAGFLGIEAADLQEGFKQIRASRKDWRRDMAREDQERLAPLFSDEVAQANWPLFANAPNYSQD
jgi:hypothetical protein